MPNRETWQYCITENVQVGFVLAAPFMQKCYAGACTVRIEAYCCLVSSKPVNNFSDFTWLPSVARLPRATGDQRGGGTHRGRKEEISKNGKTCRNLSSLNLICPTLYASV